MTCCVPLLHNPCRRVILESAGAWEIRIHPRNSTEHHQRAQTGRLHLQLWHPPRRLSILTPSLETADQYEVWPLQGQRLRLGCYHGVAALLHERLALTLPPETLITSFYTWFILAAQVGVRCTSLARTPSPSPSEHSWLA